MYRALDIGALNISVGVREAIGLAAEWGFGGVTLSPDAILKEGAGQVAAWLAERGLLNAGYGMGGVYRADGDAYEEALTAARLRAKAARAAGATRALTWITPSDKERDFDANFDYLAERLRPFATALRDEGITFALEFIGTKAARVSGKYPFIYNMRGMLRLCEATGCTLLLDSHHMHTAGDDFNDILTLKAAQIGYVHINDAQSGHTPDTLPDSPRMLPAGNGVIDVPLMLKNITRVGYEGPVVVEPFYQPFKNMQPGEILDATRAAIDSVWPH